VDRDGPVFQIEPEGNLLGRETIGEKYVGDVQSHAAAKRALCTEVLWKV